MPRARLHAEGVQVAEGPEAGGSSARDLFYDRAAVVRELDELLRPHLALEEASWSMHGIAPVVLAALGEILPEALTARLPDARVAFEARCARVWGPVRAGASLTPIPEGMRRLYPMLKRCRPL